MEFVMFMHAPADQLGTKAPTETVQAIARFAMELASEGKLKGGAQLRGYDHGFHVQPSAEGGRVIDGPFPETKELVGGYFVLELDSLDEAKEIAARCPHLAIGPVSVQPSIPREQH